MSKPVIFENAGFIKSLRGSLNLNDTCKIIQGDPSPQSSAVDAPRGSVYLRTGSSGGQVFVKLDNGSTTNWQEVGSGSSSGINYITNPNFEVSLSGWATYADAAGVSPVSGTGGAPSVTITLTPSSPLRGTQSGLFTKDAANRQGQGASYDFTINKADKAKPLKISFDYLADTGTFSAGSDSSVGDVVVYLYDVTNAQVIQPTPYKLTNGSSTIPGKFEGYFQTASNSTSYRLILHVASTSASAFTIQLDNFFVGPDAVVNGVPSNDWTSYTPTGSWVSNTTYSGKWRRVGDSMEVNVFADLTGAPTATALTVNLPSGYSIDTAKLNSTSTIQLLGQVMINDTSASAVLESVVRYSSTTAVQPVYSDDGSLGTFVSDITATAPFTFATGDSVRMIFSVPISGWSSNVQTSSDADTRVVAARAFRGSSDQSISTSAITKVAFNTSSFDTHSAFDVATNNRYIVQVPGFYEMDTSLELAGLTSGQDAVVRFYKNGVEFSQKFLQCPTGGFLTLHHRDTVSLVAGDYLEVHINSGGDTSYTVTNGTALSYVNVKRISGPATIAANELVSLRYTNSAGTSFSDDTFTTVPFATKDFDSHGSFASNTFTAPVSGTYRIHSAITWATVGTFSDGALTVRKNGATDVAQIILNAISSTMTARTWEITALQKLVAGDTIVVRANQNDSSAGSRSLEANAVNNYIEIDRLGF